MMMFVFIALPLVSVTWQSFHTTQGVYRQVTVESCSPGFLKQMIPLANSRAACFRRP